MSAKILPSEGLSSRPLTLWEHLVELARDVRYGREGPIARAGRLARHPLWNLKWWWQFRDFSLSAGSYDAAPSSLSGGSALQVEDLAPMMQCVTYSPASIRPRRRWSINW